jgi:RNA polymerase sigma-70 factor (ECF subfamily)
VYTYESHTETEWLLALRNSDEAALTAIYHHYWKPLFIQSYNVIHDKYICEDLVQELFVGLWLNRESIQILSLRAYLNAAIRYKVFRYIRNNSKKLKLETTVLTEFPDHSMEQSLMLNESLAEMESSIQTLPAQCRLIYHLSRDEQLSHKQIAEQLNISVKTVENQITIALRKLRRALNHSVTTLFFL